jgi:hypothetical protein
MFLGHLPDVGQTSIYWALVQRFMAQTHAKHVPRISSLEQKYISRPEVLD